VSEHPESAKEKIDLGEVVHLEERSKFAASLDE